MVGQAGAEFSRCAVRARLYVILLAAAGACSGDWQVVRRDAGALDDAATSSVQPSGEDGASPLAAPEDEADAADGEPIGMDGGARDGEQAAPELDGQASAADAGDAHAQKPSNDAAPVGSFCGDGVKDANEACDRGAANSDSLADACRTNCSLPRCGDRVTDQGEECDDANPAWGDGCFECSRRHYFILNQPSANSTGDDSITRVDRRGHSKVIVGPDPALNGMREIEVSRDGRVVYAVQANFGLMQNRVLLFDPLSGALRDQIKLDVNALGYDGSPTAMALGLNELLYLFVHDNTNGQAKLISVDPASKQVRPLMTLGADFAVLGMTRDDSGNLFLSTGAEIKLIQPAFMNVSTFASVSNVTGMSFEAGTLWTASSQPPRQVMRFDTAGESTPYGTLGALLGGRCILAEPGGPPLVTIESPSKVVALQSNGAFTDVWTADLNLPSDIKRVELAP